MRRFQWVQLAVLGVALGSAAADAPPASGAPDVRPGMEFRLRWAPVDRELPVYVPADYTAARRWPVVLLYHGMDGEPTTQLLRDLTGGKGAIVVGMAYIEPGRVRRSTAQEKAYQAMERAQVERLLEELPRYLRIDREQVFLAGISKGGWQVSAFAAAAEPRVAGYIILLAGRFPRAHEPRPDLAERAVYVGTGETDEANVFARMAAQYFDRCAATVTWEEFAGRGHEVDATAPRLQAWVTLYVKLAGDERRRQAREWVAARLQEAHERTDAQERFRALDELAESPYVHFCGNELRAQLAAMLDQVAMKTSVQPEVQARRVYERALWQEQTAESLEDLEGALELYRQAARRYEETTHGRLAAREARRLRPTVEQARAQTEPKSTPQRRAPAPMPPRLKLKTP